MAVHEIKIPSPGESITEVEIGNWLKQDGDLVQIDESLCEIETDKATLPLVAEVSGRLKIILEQGSVANVGDVACSIDSDAAGLIQENISASKPSAPLQEEAPLLVEKKDSQETGYPKGHPSPAARKMAKETKVDLDKIQGSGKHGVILKEDIMSLMGSKPSPSERKIKHGPEERIKMTRLRLTIAKRLKEAQENAAMLTTFNEVDMSEVIAMRNQYKEEFQNKYAVKLGFMSFFVKACVIGLKNFPAINAEIQGDEIVYKNYYNISIAVGTDRGLVVPDLRETDEMSFADIEKNIGKLGEKARDGKITINDLQGGTFTITNGGIYGSMLSTPILNPPQSAVLGMHNIVQRPIVVDGNVEVRPVMYLALSYDHRIIDGKEAVSFLKIVKESLEQPKRLFLNI